MTHLVICGLSDLAEKVKDHMPDIVISITDPAASLNDIATLTRATRDMSDSVVQLTFNDVDRVRDHCVAPSYSHLRVMEEMIDACLPDDTGTLIVHCHAGMSRSPAMAIAALAYIASRTQPLTQEMCESIITQVKTAAPHSEPNMRIVEMATSEYTPDTFDLMEAFHNIYVTPHSPLNSASDPAPLSKGAALRQKYAKKKKKVRF
jgi:predicted protein tyrosine phosphatase